MTRYTALTGPLNREVGPGEPVQSGGYGQNDRNATIRGAAIVRFAVINSKRPGVERPVVPLTVSRRLRLALAAALIVSLGSGISGISGSALAATRDPNVITRSGSTLYLHGHA